MGADRNTVIKYYDEIVAELQQERLRAERLNSERDGHIAVKITPSQKLSDYILGELKNKIILGVCVMSHLTVGMRLEGTKEAL